MKQILAMILVAPVTLMLAACGDLGGDLGSNDRLTSAEAESKLAKLVSKVDWTQNFNKRRANVNLTQANLMSSLPDISEYKVVVEPGNPGNLAVAEIYVSSEKSGERTDGWMKQAAIQFNRSNAALDNGKTAAIRIRKIASGTAYQFIGSGKAVPDAYSPSNHLWIEMVKAKGVSTEPILERTVGNVAGVVMKKSVVQTLKFAYPELTVPQIIDAVVQGQLVMGYTNPFASSTGLNFLVSILSSFSGTTDGTMLNPDVVSSFEAFQMGVPYVAMTTMQMRDSVSNSGALDAFVMEHQTFVKAGMTGEYEFIPFGIRHDNPLYVVGNTSDEKKGVVRKFAEFLQNKEWTDKAKEYGFNQLDDYKSAYDLPDGSILVRAQRIWKERKNAGKRVNAVFLVDTSGSMGGQRIAALKDALKTGSDFISKDNSIGLVSFSSAVNVEVPPQPFTLIQKSAFYAAAEDLQAGGNTAIYDGVVVSLSLLLEMRKADPDAKMMLFVLSDGEQTAGYEFGDVSEVVQGLNIPVYTISYAEDVSELKALSGLVEATSMKAHEGNAGYTIGSLLNAQM